MSKLLFGNIKGPKGDTGDATDRESLLAVVVPEVANQIAAEDIPGQVTSAVAAAPTVVDAATSAVADAMSAQSIIFARGTLTSGVDLDTINAANQFGIYQLTSSGSYPNRPSGTTGVALLEVFGSEYAVVQRLSHTGLGYDWVRNKLSTGSWSAWTPAYASRGTLPTATNVATLTAVTDSGMYRLSAANTYTGIPTAIAGIEATLEVQYISTSVVHRITAAGVMWQRFFRGGWSDWRRYGPEAVFVGVNDPEALLPVSTEYAWFKTDGNGDLIDILVGKKA